MHPVLRTLHCSPVPVAGCLGAAKVYVELAATLTALGCQATVVDPAAVGSDGKPGSYAAALQKYLHHHAAEYDVVEYEHNRLPFLRSEFPRRTLFVARSVLLSHHFLNIPIPSRPRWTSRVLHFLRTGARRRRWQQMVSNSNATCEQADLVFVSNNDDSAALIAAGIRPGKIQVLPFALSEARRIALGEAARTPAGPVVAFVGTFDPRKGLRDLPQIAKQVCGQVPAAHFRLLGTAGMIPDAAGVLAHFPRNLRARITVTPKFAPEQLPRLLAGAAVGVFPSLVEGFPFGVLEMLAAGLPVIAYRAPGPPEMLTDEYLCGRGDSEEVAQRLVSLLNNPLKLAAARKWALGRAADFSWEDVGQRTLARYQAELLRLRGGG